MYYSVRIGLIAADNIISLQPNYILFSFDTGCKSTHGKFPEKDIPYWPFLRQPLMALILVTRR